MSSSVFYLSFDSFELLYEVLMPTSDDLLAFPIIYIYVYVCLGGRRGTLFSCRDKKETAAKRTTRKRRNSVQHFNKNTCCGPNVPNVSLENELTFLFSCQLLFCCLLQWISCKVQNKKVKYVCFPQFSGGCSLLRYPTNSRHH